MIVLWQAEERYHSNCIEQGRDAHSDSNEKMRIRRGQTRGFRFHFRRSHRATPVPEKGNVNLLGSLHDTGPVYPGRDRGAALVAEIQREVYRSA